MKSSYNINFDFRFRFIIIADKKKKYYIAGESNVFQYDALYKAIENGDLGAVQMFLSIKPYAVTAKITLKDDTALHVAVLAGKEETVKELVRRMEKDELELKNNMGETAFSIATINQSEEMVRVMVEKNSNLLTVKNSYGAIPVVVASLFSAKEMEIGRASCRERVCT